MFQSETITKEDENYKCKYYIFLKSSEELTNSNMNLHSTASEMGGVLGNSIFSSQLLTSMMPLIMTLEEVETSCSQNKNMEKA